MNPLTLSLSLFLAMASLVTPLLAQSEDDQPSFDIVLKALTATDLLKPLQAGEFTIFAPTDEAFAKLPKGTVEGLLKPESKEKLVAILKYHVIAEGAKSLDQLLGKPEWKTLQGQPVDIAFKNGRVLVNQANLIDADAPCGRSTLHIIDAVLLPKSDAPKEPGNLVEVATEAGIFGTLIAAAKAAGLVDALTGKGPLTVFAPTDAAFAKLPKGTVETLLQPENKTALADILTYHVIAGKITAGDALNAGSATMLNGLETKVTFKDGSLNIAGSKITTVDITAKNGIIHIIDQVMLPPTKAKTKSLSAKDAMSLIEDAIDKGVPTFNQGDTAGCAKIYLDACKALQKTDLNPRTADMLNQAIEKASKTESTRDQSWALRSAINTVYRELDNKLGDDTDANESSSIPKNKGVLVDFSAGKSGIEWMTVNDNVMGGRSKGGFEIKSDRLLFSGATNTKGGGFSSIRTKPTSWGLTDEAGVKLRVRGDGRTYQFDARKIGAKGWVPVTYKSEFKTVKGEWIDVTIPFSSFKPTRYGTKVSGSELKASEVGVIGFMIYDKKDGPFKLEVESVKTYQDDSAAKTELKRDAF